MISTTEANEHTKYFTHHWTITMPERRNLKFTHNTPASDLDTWFAMVFDPLNRPHDATLRDRARDPAAIDEYKASTIQKYADAITQFNRIDIGVEIDDELVGGGNLSLLPNGGVNIGMQFNVGARGQGLGKLTMKMLIQLSRRIGLERLQAGTMKSNEPMRALMASLKIPERDEIQAVPGRGVVGEVLFEIPTNTEWQDLDLQVQFGQSVQVN
ncbi:hypothetical protein BGW36DRAFT_460630 [Talaromyces proteolyticus]|uniref:N-acetyltransferase domain-containing protein n=1 Tax=Talaromyces proteolyticus TaxID=1131652 RepID=A0AAD4KYC4_9EURO|nr:uncharacterized protein BGW36DRAFT_460630 [Talaromyces proteolyticus]KAH8698781.1 hypothetical protein BGW36DRAFT_460630 [Talaromyces proteolyticus]